MTICEECLRRKAKRRAYRHENREKLNAMKKARRLKNREAYMESEEEKKKLLLKIGERTEHCHLCGESMWRPLPDGDSEAIEATIRIQNLANPMVIYAMHVRCFKEAVKNGRLDSFVGIEQ